MTVGNINITHALARAEETLKKGKLPADIRAVVDLLLVIIRTFMQMHQGNSRNSSLPPSQDLFRAERSEASAEHGKRKAGGQPGRRASFLQSSETPDEIVALKVDANKLYDDIKTSRYVTKCCAQ